MHSQNRPPYSKNSSAGNIRSINTQTTLSVTQQQQQHSSINPYDIVHMTIPAAHRALFRLTIASLLLQTRATNATTTVISIMSALLQQLLQTLAIQAKEAHYSGVVWAAGTLSRPYCTTNGMLLGEDDVEREYGELARYLKAVTEANLKGPSGIATGPVGDCMQAVGLVPPEYKLLHPSGRVDDQLMKRNGSGMFLDHQ